MHFLTPLLHFLESLNGHAVGMTLGEFFIINEQLASMNAVKDLSLHMLQMKSLRELLGWGIASHVMINGNPL